MSRVEQGFYNLVLYALLHDIGKPILRFARRYAIERSMLGFLAEEVAKAVESMLGKSIDVVAHEKHDVLSEQVVRYLLKLSLDERDKKYFNEVIKSCDILAASERGLEMVKDEFMRRVQGVIAEEVKKSAGLPYSFSHEYVPLLTPTWLLLKTDYIKSVGLQSIGGDSSGRWSSVDERRKISENIFYPLQEAVEGRNFDVVSKTLIDLLSDLAQRPLWIPIKPLLPREIVELRAYSLADAMKRSSYSEVVLLLLNMLTAIKHIYKVLGFTSKGFVDTVENILRATTSLMPSAIYWSLVPDISLYSHSKLVAALTTASQLGKEGRLRLLVIDANNIQGFIAASVKAAAASRVMRGRSLLLELLLDALTEYALELFERIPQANVIVSEGGTVDIMVPDLEDFEERVKLLRSVGTELSRYVGGLLGFTVTHSKPFTLDEVSLQRAIKAIVGKTSEASFVNVLESLSRNLALEKARVGLRAEIAEVGGVIARDDEVEEFDVLTSEPVLKSSDLDPFRLTVTPELKSYADVLAGEKLEVGERISTATHLSLAIGTIARELTAIISIYVHRYDQGVAKPDREAIEKLYSELHKKLETEADVSGPLLIIHKAEKELYNMNLAFTPLEPIGALHILISLPLRKAGVYDVEDLELVPPLFESTYTIVKNVLSSIAQMLEEFQLSGRSVRVKIRFVNVPHLFIFTQAVKNLYPELRSDAVECLRNSFEKLGKVLEELIRKGIDIVLGFTFLGLYHPAAYIASESGAIKDVKLVDLDELDIIAVAKMDLDLFGEVRSLYAMSSSRLVTLSDLVNTVVAGKAYLKAVKITKKLGERYKNLDVVPLYAGGDDVTIYGKWSHVVYYIYELSKDVRYTIPPLTLSIGIAIGDAKEPLLLLYRHAVHLLEEYAKGVRASYVIGTQYKVLYPSKPQDVGKETICSAIPLEKPSEYYKWVKDPIANWNLELLAKILSSLIGIESVMDRESFEELKRELYILALIAHEFEELLNYYEMYRSGKIAIGEYKAKLTPLEIFYAYAWSRRGDNLEKLKKLFDGIDGENVARVLKYPEDIVAGRSIEEALRLLLAAKPIIDLVILALRRPESVVPSDLIIKIEK